MPFLINFVSNFLIKSGQRISGIDNLLLYKGISVHSSIEDIILLLKEIIINADILEYHFFKGADDQNDI